MAYDRFLIAPLKSGLINGIPQWQIPEDAFYQLYNAYVFRGTVRKRVGSELMGNGATNTMTAPLLSRLRAQVGTTNGTGNLSGTVPGASAVYSTLGQQFSIGGEIYTVYLAGNNQMLDTGATATKTFNTANGQFVFVGAPANTPVYYYSGQPVLGICNYEVGPINDQPTVAFDTQFAYEWQTNQWVLINSTSVGTMQWHGTNLNYYWTCNWDGPADDIVYLFVTNFNATIGAPGANDDPIWAYDGTDWNNYSNATTFLADGSFIQTALIILPFKNRLIMLNTIEFLDSNMENHAYPNRCRYSINGSPTATNAWYEPGVVVGGTNAAGAGFIDAPTKEQIVSAKFIKDRLIVQFERSTWELAYTGNQVLPFVWQQLNQELGALGTFSTVPFDKVVLAIGDTGVHACNGSNVERIDNNIPDEIFEISKLQNGSKRVAGIRDYYSELVYWSFPSIEIPSVNTNRYPDQVLVYNYANQTWALFDDTWLCYGYFFQSTDVTWADLNETWEEYDATWNDMLVQAQQRQVLAGNQQGYVLILNRDLPTNAQSLTITNVAIAGDIVTLTIMSHSLSTFEDESDYVYILDLNGVTGFVAGIYQVYMVVDVNTIQVIIPGLVGPYTGGGTMFLVSEIDIYSKQWNPYVSQGRSFYVPYLDFCVLRTAAGEITIDYFASSSELGLVPQGVATGAALGTNILETSPYALVPQEQQQQRLWHRVYCQSDGSFIQIRLYWTQEEMMNAAVSLEGFNLEGMVLNCTPTRDDLLG